MLEIVIYKAKDGHIELDVSLADETLWLSQQQMADLFGTKRQSITKHLKNIFISNELRDMFHFGTHSLRWQNLINENGLVALALLVSESDPAQKDMMVRLIVNLLMD